MKAATPMTPELRSRVKQLAREGHVRADIARLTGLSDYQVQTAARGVPRPAILKQGGHQRCSGCGYLVLMPCRICELRAQAEA